MEKIDVIMPCLILNEDLLQLTRNAIDSLGKIDNLIIIDNGSPIGGGFLREKANVYVRNQVNLGYACATNQGLKLSKNKLVCISNNDIRVSPNWQEITREVFLENNNILSVHFKMTDYDVPFTYGDRLWIIGKERWCTQSFFVVDNSKGHLFDENFFNSYDDWDFQLRARQKGWHTAYTNRASYQHNHSFTQRLMPEREENNRKNAEYFKIKHGKYAEEIFAEQFPEQMKVNYREGFE